MKWFKTQYDRRAGFTLLELILVMLILSTVLAMAAPSLRGFFGSRQLQDTAAQILSLTQLARSQAVSEGVIYRLNFNTQERAYWLSAWRKGSFKQPDDSFGRTFTLPKDMILELDKLEQDGPDMYVEFTPQGTVTAGTIRLIARSGRTLEVTCPTVTESFCIIERDDTSYGSTSSQRNG
jgi:prepilin-type N-terminal cleavage/methylation domain-containing protein